MLRRGRPGPSPAAAQLSRSSSPAFLDWATWNTAPHAQAVAWERIVGCAVRELGDGEWREVHYDGEGIPEVMTSLRTTATLIIVWEEWFDDANARRGRGPGPPDGDVGP